MMPIMSKGTRIVPIRNDLVLTMASNSRLSMTKVSCMGGLDCTDDVVGCADRFQEYLLERGLAVLEPLESHARFDEVSQKRLRIGARTQYDLGGRPTLAQAFDQRRAAQILRGVAVPRLEGHGHIVFTANAPHLF